MFFKSIKHNLAHLGDFFGRESRAGFWWYVLFLVVLHFIASILWGFVVAAQMVGLAMSNAEQGASDTVQPEMMQAMADMLMPQLVFGIITMAVTLVLLVASFVRRLHDGGFPGWIALIPAAMVVGNLVMSWLMIDDIRETLMSATTGEEMEAAAFASMNPLQMLLGWAPYLIVLVFGVWPSQKHDNRWGAYVPLAVPQPDTARTTAHIAPGHDRADGDR